MKRDPLGKLFVVALVGAVIGMAAVTRFPDSRWVDMLTRAAVFGPWIERFAQLYREQPVAESSDLEEGVEIIYRIDSGRREAVPTIMVPGATPIFAQPPETAAQAVPESAISATPATEAVNVELLDRRGDWYEVEYEGERGWVLLPSGQALGSETAPRPARRPSLESKTPPLGSKPALTLPVPSRPPDPEILAAATDLLTVRGRKALGPYVLHTDVGDQGLLVFLSAVAAQLESVYAGRYGLEIRGDAREAVVLFASEASYLRFLEAVPGMPRVSAPGVLRSGVVATYTGGRGWSEVAATLVHELTHLLNRRALGPALPPWLEEGLADDLAQCRIEGLRILPGTLGGSSVRTGARIEYKGGRAAVIELGRALGDGTLPELEALVATDWDAFQSSARRSLRYSQASFFVRSMLDSPDPELARAFRGYLRDVSEGRPVAAEELLRRLDQSWQSLDARLASFVRRQADAAGLPISGESGSSSRHASEPSS